MSDYFSQWSSDYDAQAAADATERQKAVDIHKQQLAQQLAQQERQDALANKNEALASEQTAETGGSQAPNGAYGSGYNSKGGGYVDPTQLFNFQDQAAMRDMNYTRNKAFYDQLNQAGGVINPNTYYQGMQGFFNQAGQAAQAANPWMAAIGDLSGRMGTDVSAQMANLQRAIANANPQTAYTNFQGVNPQLQQTAASVADQATQLYGQSMQDLAAQQSRQQVRDLSQQMANSGVFGTQSGASARALAQGANDPWAQALSQVALQRSNIYNQTYQPQANQILQGFMTEPERQAQAMQSLIQGYQGQMGGYQSAMDAAAQQAALYGGLGQQYGATGRDLMGQLADQSQQMVVAPQLQNEEGTNKGWSDFFTQLAAAGIGGWTGGLG